jgi:hypothetical protein
LDSSSLQPHVLFFQPLLTSLFPVWSGYVDFLASFTATFPLLQKYVDAHKASYDPTHPRDLIDIYLGKMYSATEEDSSFYGEEGGERI